MAAIRSYPTRRAFTQGAAQLVGAVPVIGLVSGCRVVDVEGSDWATGGAAAVGGPYPDPFEGDVADSCDVTCSTILGPCYAQTFLRRDISEGQDGLPMRLSFRVVDDLCRPIDGAEVDIWHTSPTGHYSGEDALESCTSGDEVALAGQAFRGVQITDAHGRCDFDSCFPGWYTGRTPHVHVQVRLGEDKLVTTQLYFDQTLIDDVLTTHPVYEGRGAAQTSNAADGVLPHARAAEFTFPWARMDDGVLVVWKTVVVRSDLERTRCVA